MDVGYVSVDEMDAAARAMGTHNPSTTEQIEALRDLIQSSGWKLFLGMVREEIAGTFEDSVTRALSDPDATVALDKARQVAAVRLAGLRWLKLPEERVRMLTEQMEQKDERAHAYVGRRPPGL